MDTVPPLNLSTYVKVEDSQNSVLDAPEFSHISTDNEITNEEHVEKGIVLYQTSSQSTYIAITGEAVEESCADTVEQPKKNVGRREKKLAGNSAKSEQTEEVKCSQCPSSFATAYQLKIHLRQHEMEKVHTCDICDQSFHRLSLLMRHKLLHKVNEAAAEKSYNKAQRHPKKSTAEKKFKCDDCEMSFVQLSHLISHKRKHTGEKPFSCYICTSSFKQVSHLTTHIRTHTKVKPFTCEFCNASFSQTGSLKRHRRSHTGEKPYECKQCGTCFVEKRNLNRHMLSHSGIRPFKCDICPASFTQLIDLQRHKFSHSGFKPFKCEVCEAAFSRHNNLKWHRLTHEGDTPHKCEICNVGFKLNRDLKNHKKFHIEKKPYSCTDCKASFFQLNTLKRHKLIHSGAKPFSCERCDAHFFEKSSLKRHISKHENRSNLVCNICLSPFLDMRSLRKHIFNVHKGQNSLNNLHPARTEIDSPIADQVRMKVPFNQEKDAALYSSQYNANGKLTQSTITAANPGANSNTEITSKPASGLPDQAVCQVIVNENFDPDGSSVPTLMLSQPGQPPKPAKPAGSCQNHHAHFHTIVEGSNSHWQAWCFCETPNIPPTSDAEILPTPESTHSLAEYSDFQQVEQVTTTSRQMYGEREIKQTNIDVNLPTQMIDYNNQAFDVSVAPNNQVTTVSETLLGGQVVVGAYENNPTASQHLNLSTDSSHHSLQYLPTSLGEATRDLPEPLAKKFATDSDISYNSLYYPQSTLKKSLPVSNDSNFDSVLYKTLVSKNQSPKIVSENGIAVPYVVDNLSKITRENVPAFDNGVNVATVTHVALNSEQIHDNSGENLIARALSAMDKDCPTDLLSQQGSSISIPETIELHNSKESEVIPAYQISLYENISPEQPPTKKNVTVQYNLTVNNPATGDIQVQSAFGCNFDKMSSSTPPCAPQKSRDPIVMRDPPPPPPAEKGVKTKRPKSGGAAVAAKKELVCSFCSKVFHRQHVLNLHIKKHFGGKPFTCGVCKQNFSHTNSLTIHMRSHTGEKPFSCIFCKAAFTQKSNLLVHLRTHTGERPFKCDVCNVAFSQGSHLIAHKRIHNNERPFVCEVCGQAFTQRSALKRHSVKHTGARRSRKPHSCRACSASFAKKIDLKNHQCSQNTEERQAEGNATISTSLAPTANTTEEDSGNMNGERAESDAVPKNDENVGGDASSDATPKQMECSSQVENEEGTLEVPSEKRMPDNKPTSKRGSNKPKRKPIVPPVRSSKRIKEKMEKSPVRNPDFITGDLNEIDQMEQFEEELIKLRNAPNSKSKKEEEVTSTKENHSVEMVDHWCFCEVPHRPDEPHTCTNDTTDLNNSSSAVAPSKSSLSTTIHSVAPSCSDDASDILQLPQLQQSVVVQSRVSGDTNNLNQYDSSNMVISSSSITPGQHQQLVTANEAEFTTTSQCLPVQSHIFENPANDTQQSMSSDGSKTVYGTTQVLTGHVLPNSQFITTDGTSYYFAPGDIINGAMVLNSSSDNGTIFFDISGEEQLVNLNCNSMIVDESSSQAASDGGSRPRLPTNESVVVSSGRADGQQQQMSLLDGASSSSTVASSTTILGQAVDSGIPPATDPGMFSSVNVIDESGNLVPASFQVHYPTLESGEVNLINSHIPMDTVLETTSSIQEVVSTIPASPTTLLGRLKQPTPIVITPSKCTICSKEFAVKSSLKKHLKTAHASLHFCLVCFQAFTSKENLAAHKFHCKESHACPECGSKFATKLLLGNHRSKEHNVITSTGLRKTVRNFHCSDCDASFFQLSDLNRHILSHTGEKPFKCKQCETGFTRKSSLKKHYRIHTGEKPYVCPHCFISFAYRYQFNRHTTCNKSQ